MKTGLCKDDQGIDTIPLKLIIYLVLIGIIIIITASGLKNAAPTVDASIMEHRISEVKSSIEQMQSGFARDLSDPYAPAGNIRHHELTLPDSLEYLCLGTDPDPDNNGNLTDTPPGLTTDDGNVIYYKLTGSGKNLVKLDDRVHLREGDLTGGRWMPNVVDGLQQALVITGSSQSVTFELVSDRGITYTLIHSTDDINAYINPDKPHPQINNVMNNTSIMYKHEYK
jgi:type II secretory pathway pseudopilin PulG